MLCGSVRPESIPDFIGAFVDVFMADGTSVGGVVHSVDPKTGSIVLLVTNEQGDLVSTDIIMGQSISSVEKSKFDAETSRKLIEQFNASLNMGTDSKLVLSVEEINVRKDYLAKWFTENRLPFTMAPVTNAPPGEDVSAFQILDGVALIPPPYTPDDIQCSNEIVLSRLRGLVERLPTGVL